MPGSETVWVRVWGWVSRFLVPTDVGDIPKVMFPFVEFMGGGADVKQQHGGIAVDQPMAVDHLDTGERSKSKGSGLHLLFVQTLIP